jgi:uncharacterized protein (TIGR00251 family)
VGTPAQTLLAVRVTPRAARDAIGPWRQGRLTIRTTAPPVDGAANKALCQLLASTLRLPASAVQVVRGQRGRDKLVRIMGLTPDDVASTLMAT